MMSMPSFDLPPTLDSRRQIIDNAVTRLRGFGSDEVKEFQKNTDSKRTSPENLIPPFKKLAYSREGNRELTFFGVTHDNIQAMTELRDDLRDNVLSQKNPENIAFMIEGRHSEKPYDREQALKDMEGVTSFAQAVEKFHESGVALWCVADYARRNPPVVVEISSPEASEKDIAELLKKKFSTEDIALHLMLRQWTSEIGGDEEKRKKQGEYSLKDFARYAYHVAELSGVDWISEMKSKEEIQELFANDPKKLEEYMLRISQEFLKGLNAKFGFSITLEQLKNRQADDALLKEMQSSSGAVGEVSDAWNTERDKFLVKEIGNAMIRGKKPYVIFGASHAVSCKPALEKLQEIKI